MPQTTDALKRLLLGRAMRSDRLGETLLSKRIALPVFASDALSSVAYAPDEIFLTLGVAGFAAMSSSTAATATTTSRPWNTSIVDAAYWAADEIDTATVRT